MNPLPSRPAPPTRHLLVSAVLLVIAALLLICCGGCAVGPATISGQEVSTVSVNSGAMKVSVINDRGQVLKSWPCSLGRNGLGGRPGSNKTPVGTFYIKSLIGEGASQNQHFRHRVKTRRNSGMIARIIWLGGRSKDGYRQDGRYIYIHGNSRDMGKWHTKGCINMRVGDVIELFDLVKVRKPKVTIQ